jgi:hypothetical protein
LAPSAEGGHLLQSISSCHSSCIARSFVRIASDATFGVVDIFCCLRTALPS